MAPDPPFILSLIFAVLTAAALVARRRYWGRWTLGCFLLAAAALTLACSDLTIHLVPGPINVIFCVSSQVSAGKSANGSRIIALSGDPNKACNSLFLTLSRNRNVFQYWYCPEATWLSSTDSRPRIAGAGLRSPRATPRIVMDYST